VTTQTQHARHARTRTAVTSLSSPRWNSARAGAVGPDPPSDPSRIAVAFAGDAFVWSGRAAATSHPNGGSQQKRSPRRGTGSTGFRDCPPAAVAVASRERMRLCRCASASAREPLLSEAPIERRPARSVSRATAAVARENNPRVDRAPTPRHSATGALSLGALEVLVDCSL